ncbi:PDDEXK family nuclease [Anaerocellum danielii]|uniref:Card1 CARF domain-containing protein n=1 Tax=Anaerocellum danielii TaxID=1387557 RepID=A0ABZ0TZQ7_9FIRM|nr:hypothetical protein [Caldicellulosiruptor danielii]WPX08961.1 hypothetical protein SOJ16_000127 [Caldicellulosiruptor danielii]
MNSNKILFITVGTNPLPVYVVAKYFEDSFNNVVLISSEENRNIYQAGTRAYAEKIKDTLESNVEKYHIISLSNVANPAEIKRDLKNHFKNNKILFSKENIQKVHLNYTGGTKIMAVAVYNFLKEEYGEKFESSYLDARSYKLILEDGTVEPTFEDLREKVKIDIETLLKLHLYEVQEIKNDKKYIKDFGEKYYFEIINEMEKIVNDDNKRKAYLEWINNYFRKVFKDKKDKQITTPTKLSKHLNKEENKKLIEDFESFTPDFIWELLDKFPDGRKIITKKGKLWVPDRNSTKNEIEDTIKFLDGEWLELYVYNQIKERLKNEQQSQNDLLQKIDFGRSIIAFKGKENRKAFEMDIFIIYGYQLIGISVTTATERHICKSKGFEVVHRTRQIGGDESRAILVTGYKSPKDLEEDLSYETGTSTGKIIVFGPEDWKDIGQKILREVFS